MGMLDKLFKKRKDRKGEHFSLHIGINYQGTPSALSGCINDARDLAMKANLFGYKSTLLLEEDATKEKILLAIQMVSANASQWPKNPIIITQSGHGTRVKDYNNEEEDGNDECFCPYDFEDNLIFDDEYNKLFEMIPNPVIFISDSCHSGGINRVAGHQFSKDAPKPKSMNVGDRRYSKDAEILESHSKAVIKPNNVTISGCESYEYSYDIQVDGRSCGALTHTILGLIQKGMTVGELYKGIIKKLPNKNQGWNQSPTITGNTGITF